MSSRNYSVKRTKLTADVFLDYCRLVVQKSMTQTAACKQLNIGRATVQTYLKSNPLITDFKTNNNGLKKTKSMKKIFKETVDVVYFIMKNSKGLCIVFEDDFVPVDLKRHDEKLIDDLVNRKEKRMTKTESELIKDAKFSPEVAELKNQFEKEFSVVNGQPLFMGKPISKDLYEALKIFKIKSLTHNRLYKFLNKLHQNPDKAVHQMLYTFIKANDIVIDRNGDVRAFKYVDAKTYLDSYSKTYKNSPGKIIEMDRKDVDSNPNNTCSRGLHVCSAAYIKSCGAYNNANYAIMETVINPKDFVAVPTDYQHTKARVCKYKVTKNITKSFK